MVFNEIIIGSRDITKTVADIDWTGMQNWESLLKTHKLTSLYAMLLYTDAEMHNITGIPLKDVKEIKKRGKHALEGTYNDKMGPINFICKNIRFVLDDFGFDIRGTLVDKKNSDKYLQLLQNGRYTYERFSSYYRDELFVDIPVITDMSLVVLAQHGHQSVIDWEHCLLLAHPKDVGLSLKNYVIDSQQPQNTFVYFKSRIYTARSDMYKVHICVRANAIRQALQDLDNYQHCTKIFPNMKLPVARSISFVDIPSSYAYVNIDAGGAANIVLYPSHAFTEYLYDFIEYWKNTQSEAQYRVVTPIRFNTRISKSLYFMYGEDSSTRTDALMFSKTNIFNPSTEIQLVKSHICNNSFSDYQRAQQQGCLQKNYSMSRTDLCESEIPNVWKKSQPELSKIDPRFTQIMSRCISKHDWPVMRKKLLIEFQCNMIKLGIAKPDVVQTMLKLLKGINIDPATRRLDRSSEQLSNVYADIEAIKFMKFIGWWESPPDNPYRFVFYGLKTHVNDGIILLESSQRPELRSGMMYYLYCDTDKFANEKTKRPITDFFESNKKLKRVFLK